MTFLNGSTSRGRCLYASMSVKARHDVVVVGSDYGDGIAASRMARTRRPVC